MTLTLLACVCAQGKVFYFNFTCSTFFPFWNGCFQLVWSPQNLKPALSKHNTHCVFNIGCTPHSLAWYNFCLFLGPKSQIVDSKSPTFGIHRLETEFWPLEGQQYHGSSCSSVWRNQWQRYCRPGRRRKLKIQWTLKCVVHFKKNLRETWAMWILAVLLNSP